MKSSLSHGSGRPLGMFLDEQGKERKLRYPEEQGVWKFDEDDYTLYALLCDPVYHAELLWDNPGNRDYGGMYVVWDYQYRLFRTGPPREGENYAGFTCARSVGKTESVKARACAHAFKRIRQNLLVTAPELIHLLPLTDAIEEKVRGSRLMREFLFTDNQKTGFTHRPFVVDFADGTKIVGRIPRLTGTGVKGMHQPDLIIDECFPAGTLVLTRDGQKPIETVRAGDEVLTHLGRWRPVTSTARRRRETCEVVGQGHPGLVVSVNHPFWVRQQNGRGTQKTHGHQCRLFDDARMVPAQQLAPAAGYASDNQVRNGAYYWSSPTVFPVDEVTSPPVLVNDDFWWLVGFYMAEGCVSVRGDQATFSVHADEAPDVERRLASIGVDSHTSYDSGSLGARVITRAARDYAEWLVDNVGRVAAEHEAKPWLLGQPEQVRQAVLDGYIAGDGNGVRDARYAPGRWQATCADRKLVLSVKLLAQSLGYFTSLYWVPPPKGPRTIRGRGWYQLRGNRRSQTAFVDDDKQFARVARATPTGEIEDLYDLAVADDHSFVADGIVVSNSQDYPEKGWIEVHETVMKDTVDSTGRPDFTYHFYGVHSGARDSGFAARAQGGGFKVVNVTAMMRPGWGKAEKDAAKAAYGGTANGDYRRNILGEPGGAASPYFVTARLMACVDQDRESRYNTIEVPVGGSMRQLIRAEEFSELVADGASSLDVMRNLLDLPSGYRRVWGGMDVGLTNSPTVITMFSEEKVGKVDRLKLIRRIHLERMRTRHQREALYVIAAHFGQALQGFGMDITGLGFPIWQEMEDDETCPPRLMEIATGYFFNAKIPVGVDKANVVTDEKGRMRDQLGAAVTEEFDPLTGVTRYVTHMPMIEASTRYLREMVDPTFLMLPFDPDLVADMQGETTQRVKRIAGLKQKPNAFHVLDSMRAMAMKYREADVMEQLALPAQEHVMDVAL